MVQRKNEHEEKEGREAYLVGAEVGGMFTLPMPMVVYCTGLEVIPPLHRNATGAILSDEVLTIKAMVPRHDKNMTHLRDKRFVARALIYI